MESVANLLCDYCLPKNFFEQFSDLEGILDIELTKTFLTKVKKYIPWVLNQEEALVTGMITYLGIILYSRMKGVGNYDLSLLHFVLLYINLDYVLDDPQIPKEVKKNILQDCKIILDTQDLNVDCSNKYSLAARKSIKNILNNSCCSWELLRECFDLEKKSLAVQVPNVSDRDKLYNICVEKADVCVRLVANIIGVEEEYSREIGALIQLFDDFYDYYDDQNSSIETIVTYDIENTGSIEGLVFDYLKILEKVPYWYIKIAFMYGLIIHVAVSPYVSENLRSIFQQFYPCGSPDIEHVPNKFMRNFFARSLKKMKDNLF